MKNPVVTWLNILAILVIIMVAIGGTTRLTGSGLSMTRWKPISGALPPMTEVAWNEEFAAYQKSPEYIKKNSHMKLDDFKKIFFWEYFHRLFGRLIGLVFAIPFLIFLIRKKIPDGKKLKLFFAFILGGSQGLLGWWMVKSGLVDIPEVSHYRLCAHLILAFIIIFYLKVLSLEVEKNRTYCFTRDGLIFTSIMALLLVQIIYGAFLAGLDGGLTYNTFPKMGRSWIPDTLFAFSPWIKNFFENTALIQFIHRILGSLLLLSSVFCFYKFKKAQGEYRSNYLVFGILIWVQFALGVLTLVNLVPISLAVLHQFGASLLIFFGAKCFFFLNTGK